MPVLSCKSRALFLPLAVPLAALLWSCLPQAARAQADGSGVESLLPQQLWQRQPAQEQARIAPAGAPGGALMNNLHERMRQIQATQDAGLRQRKSNEFLKALQDGMANLGKPAASGPDSRNGR